MLFNISFNLHKLEIQGIIWSFTCYVNMVKHQIIYKAEQNFNGYEKNSFLFG